MVSLEAAVLQHLQVLLVQFLLGFKELLQLLGLALAQLFAFSVVGRQTLQGPHRRCQLPLPRRPHLCSQETPLPLTWLYLLRITITPLGFV